MRTFKAAASARCRCGYQVPGQRIAALVVRDEAALSRRPRNHWRPLHRYAVRNWDCWDVTAARRFYSRWVATIPSYSCSCRANFLREVLPHVPMEFDAPQAFEVAAWMQHERVRQILGQPPCTLQTAQRIARLPLVGWIATSYMAIGGTETFHRTLLPRLHGDQVWIDGFAVTGDFHAGDPRLLGLPWHGVGIEAARQLAARVDCVVVWGVSDLAEILPTPRPRVIAVHHSDPSSAWSGETITRNVGLVDHAVAVHPEVNEDLLGIGVTHIGNPIDPARYQRASTAGLRERWGIPADSRMHFYCHRLSGEKRPLLAIEVARALPEGHMLVVAGEGPLAHAVQEATECIPALRYVGPVDNPAAWLSTASSFLMLSEFEGFGLAAAEAMAAGVPVVSTPCGVCTESTALLVRHDESAATIAQRCVAAVGADASAARQWAISQTPESKAQQWQRVILDQLPADW